MRPVVQKQDHFPHNYFLLNPEREEVQSHIANPLTFSNLFEFFVSDTSTVESSQWLWSTFARPATGVQRRQAFYRRSYGKPTTIEALPNEILYIILDLLADDNEAVLAFGLASVYFWPIVLHRIHQGYQDSLGSWVGERVAFHDWNSHSTLDAFIEILIQKPPFRGPYRTPAGFGARNLTHVMSPPEKWRNTLKIVKDWQGFCAADWIDIEQDLSTSYLYPQDRVWVLRNLMTREFVRSDKLQPKVNTYRSAIQGLLDLTGINRISSALNSFRRKTSLPPSLQKTKSTSGRLSRRTPVTFPQIFLLMTCFSTNHWYPERLFNFQQGIWAGHGFDIVGMDYHILEGEKDWKDVSQSFVNYVANLRREADGFGPRSKMKARKRALWIKLEHERKIYNPWRGCWEHFYKT